MVFIRILFGSNGYPIFLFVISVATLFPVIYVTNKYQSQISQQVALIMYTSIYYFQGFSLNRIYLSASIGLLAYDAILEKKKWKSMAMILLATCFHISSLIMFVPYVLLMFRRIGKKTILLLETIIGCAVFLGRGSIYSMMASSTRYYVYSASNGVNIGFEQFAYYLPIIFLWYYSKKKYGIKNRYFEFVSLAYIGSGFLFGLIGYIVPIFGRMQVLFLPLCINVSYYAKPLLNRRRDRYILNILLIIYCISRFYIYISQYYLLDDIMPYITFWGLNI